MKNTLKDLRKNNGFTQQQAADYFGISLRSYKTYENDESKIESIKYKYMLEKLEERALIDEEHGILSIEDIKNKVSNVLSDYDVDYCYLFGSYAKDKANENSDVDLLISTKTSGLKFYGLVERLREELKKKVDLLNVNQLENNTTLLNEILKEGIKIYGQQQKWWILFRKN